MLKIRSESTGHSFHVFSCIFMYCTSQVESQMCVGSSTSTIFLMTFSGSILNIQTAARMQFICTGSSQERPSLHVCVCCLGPEQTCPATSQGKKYFTWHPSHFAQPDKLLTALEALVK